MSLKGLLNLANLRIARENAGYTTMEATIRVCSRQSKRDRVKEWEEGVEVPTFKQLDKLAKIYEINVFLLSLRETIDRNRIITDYRRSGENISTLNEKKFINLMLQRQRYVSYIMREESSPKNKLVGSISERTSPQAAANHIRKALGYKYEGKGKHLEYLIELLEEQWIFVMKTLSYWKIPVENMRGVYLDNKYAPFIALNRQDSKRAQLFTLAHEVAHLFLKSEGISNTSFRGKTNSKIEALCNKIAANFLLPREYFHKDDYGEQDIRELSNKYQVSNLFVLYRLDSLNLISSENFTELETKIKEETVNNIKKVKGSHGGSYINNMKDSNGFLYNNFIVSLYLDGEISPAGACNLLKLSVDQVD